MRIKEKGCLREANVKGTEAGPSATREGHSRGELSLPETKKKGYEAKLTERFEKRRVWSGQRGWLTAGEGEGDSILSPKVFDWK